MTYNIRKNWLSSLGLIVANPILIMPFVLLAFFEGLALEILYFFPRPPLANLFGPLITKFFSPAAMHYPVNLVILPRLFYYAQMSIYIFGGVLLSAICVHIFENVKMGLAVQIGLLIKKACQRYLSFLAFGVIMVLLIFVLRKISAFCFFKAIDLIATELPQVLSKLAPFIFTLVLFLANVVLQTFLVLTIPLIVIKKKSLFVALGRSIALGLGNFFNIFMLIFLPLLIYLPIVMLKTDPAKLAQRIYPEINLLILVAGIFVAIMVECFITVCAAEFLLDKD